MAITRIFTGQHIRLPGYYGDPNSTWFNNKHRKPLFLLMGKLNIRSTQHYSYYHDEYDLFRSYINQ